MVKKRSWTGRSVFEEGKNEAKIQGHEKIEKILTKVRYQSQPSIFNFMLVFSVLSFVNYSLTGRTILNKN